MLPISIAFTLLAAIAGQEAAATRPLSSEDLFLRDEQLRAMGRALHTRDMQRRADVPLGYSPYKIDCPSDVTWVRQGDGLNDGETKYLANRAPQIDAAVKTMVEAVGLAAPARRPVIAVAHSGGGYRAMINTLGAAQGLMADSTEAKAAGTGGWFEAATYQAGLSGGSWAVGTFISNDGMLPTDLATNVWNLQESFIMPTSVNVTDYFAELFAETEAKQAAGFPVQVTDIYGLALGEHLLPEKWRMANGANMTFSELMNQVPKLANASLPYPIITTVGLEAPNSAYGALNATVWSWTPYELGTWNLKDTSNESVLATPITYLGSGVNNGNSNGTCYKGLDQLSFVMGASGSLFNEMNATGIDITSLFQATPAELGIFNATTKLVCSIPNPFQGLDVVADSVADESTLTLVDGGENDQVIPFDPLLVKARAVDVIVALDAGADTAYNYPDGSALVATYKAEVAIANLTGNPVTFPEVPGTNSFINLGLNTRPTFFGCNNTAVPLVIYVPHYHWSALTNTSTFQLAYANGTDLKQLESTQMGMTLNGTVAAWPTCLACAFTDRANYTTAANRSEDCTKCFDAFCWNGETNETLAGKYAPAIGAPAFVSNLNLTVSGSSASGSGSSDKKSAASTMRVEGALVATAVLAAIGLVL